MESMKKLADAAWFQNFVTAVIIAAGVLVGFETYPSIAEANHSLFQILNTAILIVFIVEAVVKILAEVPRPWNYFKDPWNVFDFAIVVACLLPLGGSVAVLRLLRLLRVLKLINSLPKLQILVGALLKSIPSMFYVTIFLVLLFYVYAVAAVLIFGANDPVHFENLTLSILSLFRVVTLEDWTDVMYISMYGCEGYGYGGMEERCTDSHAFGWVGAMFFVSFVMMGTMIILNLFIGVIMSGMDEAQKESEVAQALNDKENPTVLGELKAIETQLESINTTLDNVRELAKRLEKQVPAENPPPAD